MENEQENGELLHLKFLMWVYSMHTSMYFYVSILKASELISSGD